MSDSFTMADLKREISNLEERRFSNSLVDDPTFKVFQTALSDEYSDLYERWRDMFQLQVYPDPTDYLASVQGFREQFYNHEPGCYVDYKRMRENLDDHRNYICGGSMAVLDMYDFLNKITGAHADFIRSHVALAGWELFGKMIDRFYGCVQDEVFETFVKYTLDTTAERSSWPVYEDVLTTLHANMEKAEQTIYNSKILLATLKASERLPDFYHKIEEANMLRLQHEETVKQAAKARIAAKAERILSRRLGRQARAARAQRSAEQNKRKITIMLRNATAHAGRVEKYAPLRNRNRNNIHQFGSVSRTPLSAGVIQAINAMQDQCKDGLLEDDDPRDDLKMLKKQKDATTIKKEDADGDIDIDGDGYSADVEDDAENTQLTIALQDMSVQDFDALEAKMKVQEPLGGIVVGSGYTCLEMLGAPTQVN